MSDLGNMDLSSALLELIRNSLSGENSLDNIKSKINIPILLLHECNITEVENEFTNEYQGKIIDFHRDKANKYFEKQVNKMADIFKYADIKFHLILFPIPNKKAIVDSFVKNADHHRSQ
jgi:DNA-directed RNA polymerase subunit E'/Rpb7